MGVEQAWGGDSKLRDPLARLSDEKAFFRNSNGAGFSEPANVGSTRHGEGEGEPLPDGVQALDPDQDSIERARRLKQWLSTA